MAGVGYPTPAIFIAIATQAFGEIAPAMPALKPHLLSLGIAALLLLPLGIWAIRNPAAASLKFINALARVPGDRLQTNIAYGPHPENQLDIYLPPQSQPTSAQANAPVIVFFYGGCWGACLKFYKSDYRFVAESLAKEGYVVVLPDYRYHPNVKFPAIMTDATAAVEWVNENIEQYGGDPAQLFLSGHSAGAQMAVLLTLNEDYLHSKIHNNIKGFIGLAGPYDFLPFDQAYQPILFGPEENYPISQPINYVDGNEPPLLLLYGNDDTIVFPRNIENLSAKVNQLGGEVEVHRYDRIDHSGIVGALSVPFRNRQPVYADILNFLNQHRH